MDFFVVVLTVALSGLAASVVDFIPVVNVITDIVNAVGGSTEAAPSWWAFGLKMAETVAFLQLIMPMLESLTRRTENTWDDGLVAKLAMILAFAVEILAAIGAFDPQLGKRIAAITGPRRTRP